MTPPEWQVPGWLASFAAWSSIACLIALAALNAASVLRTPRHAQVRLAGLRSRWFGARHSTGALGIMGVGALFAVSFDTLSQAAMFALAAQRSTGLPAALLCALVFVGGMLVTDGLNGLWTAQLLRRADANAAAASRAMGWAIVAVSLLAAGLGLGRQFGVPAMAWADGHEPLASSPARRSC